MAPQNRWKLANEGEQTKKAALSNQSSKGTRNKQGKTPRARAPVETDNAVVDGSFESHIGRQRVDSACDEEGCKRPGEIQNTHSDVVPQNDRDSTSVHEEDSNFSSSDDEGRGNWEYDSSLVGEASVETDKGSRNDETVEPGRNDVPDDQPNGKKRSSRSIQANESIYDFICLVAPIYCSIRLHSQHTYMHVRG